MCADTYYAQCLSILSRRTCRAHLCAHCLTLTVLAVCGRKTVRLALCVCESESSLCDRLRFCPVSTFNCFVRASASTHACCGVQLVATVCVRHRLELRARSGACRIHSVRVSVILGTKVNAQFVISADTTHNTMRFLMQCRRCRRC